jgi:hypothetical protein
MKPALRKLKRVVLAPFIWLAAAIFLIEEAIWDWTATLMARLGAIRAVHAVEKHIAGLPPRWAFLTFILPSLIFIPAKLVGVEAIVSGHWVLGSGVFLFAKVAGFALFSRIFNLTRPTLMQLAWFARVYTWIMGYRNRIHAYLDSWPAYQRIRQRIHALLQGIKSALRGVSGQGLPEGSASGQGAARRGVTEQGTAGREAE